MIGKPSKFYKLNLAFGILSFLVTITLRTELVYGMLVNIHVASTILMVWNWLMLISLTTGAGQTLLLSYKFGGKAYVLLSILMIVCLIITTIGMFLIPSGTILS